MQQGRHLPELTAKKIINAVKQIGFDVAERDNFYRTIKEC